MNFPEYQAAAERTAKIYPQTAQNLIHAALGLSTETGEFTTEVKRHVVYEKPLDAEINTHLIEELGDILWYVSLAATALGVPLAAIARRNIEKLQARYPEKYSNFAAEARVDKGGLSAKES